MHDDDDAPRAGGAIRRMMIRRGKLFTVVFVALVGGLFALEMFVLQGTCVFDERIELREGAKVEIRLDRVGEPHLIEFYTRRERRLKGTMTAPDGSEVWSLDEWADHKSHYVSFTPEVAGTYVLEAQRGFLLGGSSRGVRSRVQVFVNDRRWFGPLMYSLGF